jgi:hypothetical protein
LQNKFSNKEINIIKEGHETKKSLRKECLSVDSQCVIVPNASPYHSSEAYRCVSLGNKSTTCLDVTVLIPDLGVVYAVVCNLCSPLRLER